MTDREASRGLRIGVVGVRGAWSSERLADALAERTDYRLLVDMSEVALEVTTGRALYQSEDLGALDALVVKKVSKNYGPEMLDRLEMLRFVAESGVRVFSEPTNVLRLIDRLACTVTLAKGGIAMPPTFVTEDIASAVEVVCEYRAAVLKPLYSNKARGMRIVEAQGSRYVEEELVDFQAEGNPVLYIQKKIDVGDRDLGVVFMGGEFQGCYARVRGTGAWNTTVHAGGRYEAHEPSAEIVEIAQRAQSLFGLDFTSVDVADSEDGPVVFEVSAFGAFRGMRDGLGVDIASRYADWVIASLS